MLRPYLTLLYALLVIALAATIWFSGVHHGTVTATESCNVERLSVATATNHELVRLKDLAEKYAIQITDANDARNKARSELVRLARLPHAHLVCHTTASGGSDTVPIAPSATGLGPAFLGELSVQPDFDPSPALYAEARRADAVVEGCRDVLNRWPN